MFGTLGNTDWNDKCHTRLFILRTSKIKDCHIGRQCILLGIAMTSSVSNKRKIHIDDPIMWSWDYRKMEME